VHAAANAFIHEHNLPIRSSVREMHASGNGNAAGKNQRERKRRWQKAKRAYDADYRDNDAQAGKRWRNRHSGYWQEYRRKNPRTVILNRDKQRERDRSRRSKSPPALNDASTRHLANEDASIPLPLLESGTYNIIPVTRPHLANEDACLVKISLLSGG